MIFILGHLTKMATMPIYGKTKYIVCLNNKPKFTCLILTLLRKSGGRIWSSSLCIIDFIKVERKVYIIKYQT